MAVKKFRGYKGAEWIVESTQAYTQATHYEQDTANGAESVTIVQFSNPDAKRKHHGLRVLSINLVKGEQVSCFDDYISVLKSGKPFTRSKIQYTGSEEKAINRITVKGYSKNILLRHMVSNLP